MNKKIKRILAWTGIGLLLALYLTTLILSLMGYGLSSNLLGFSILATVFVPIFLWVVFRIIGRSGED